jgi:hypothetical protein
MFTHAIEETQYKMECASVFIFLKGVNFKVHIESHSHFGFIRAKCKSSRLNDTGYQLYGISLMNPASVVLFINSTNFWLLAILTNKDYSD